MRQPARRFDQLREVPPPHGPRCVRPAYSLHPTQGSNAVGFLNNALRKTTGRKVQDEEQRHLHPQPREEGQGQAEEVAARFLAQRPGTPSGSGETGTPPRRGRRYCSQKRVHIRRGREGVPRCCSFPRHAPSSGRDHEHEDGSATARRRRVFSGARLSSRSARGHAPRSAGRLTARPGHGRSRG